MLPILARVFRMHKRVVGTLWRYHHNIVEQDHRTEKRVTNKVLDFTSFWSEKNGSPDVLILVGIATSPRALRTIATQPIFHVAEPCRR